MMQTNSYVVTICGGSASGKTTLALKLQEALGAEACSILLQDSYYIDQRHKFDTDGGSVNFDHPDALDFDLMAEHIGQLRKNNLVRVPIYNFKTLKRNSETINLEPKPFIIIDGILVLSQSKIREVSDLMIYVECEEGLRYERRLKRDTEQRGRTPDGVKAQFYNQVKPMHDKYVEASKNHAQIIVNQENFEPKLEEILLCLKTKLKTNLN